jgi:flagellin-like hook-associated protein FlgL
MADTDVAKSYSEMVKGQALQQYQIAMLSEANKFPGSVLRLVA